MYAGHHGKAPARNFARPGENNMAIRGVEVSKLERFLHKNQQTQLLNFDNWVIGEVSKIGHHFSK